MCYTTHSDVAVLRWILPVGQLRPEASEKREAAGNSGSAAFAI